MARANKRVVQKKREQAELKELNAIQITIVASEANLQRLAALMMFADHLQPKLIHKEQLAPMPWEDPNDPKYVPPKLEIDRAVVERAITPLLTAYYETHGVEKATSMVQSFGAERVKLLTDEQLLGLHDALAAEAPASE